MSAARARDEWTNDVESQSFTPREYSSASLTEMSFQASRTISPTSFGPFRFGSHSDGPQAGKGKEGLSSAFFPGGRSRRTSALSRSNDKGKEPANGKSSIDSSTSPTSTSPGFGADPFSSRYNGSSSLASHESPWPSAAGSHSNITRRSRGSILVAASDALGFKFGRKRQPIRPPVMPVVLPDVIEISAPRRDEEVEERNRLRNIAAQAIGLSVMMGSDSREGSIEEEAEAEAEVEAELEESDMHPTAASERENRELNNARIWEPMSNTAGKSPQGSSLSISMSPPALPSRYRSGSISTRSRPNSTNLTSVPSFPANLAALNQLSHAATMVPKYYPPSSLRIFALSKSWRSRFMVLSAPIALATRGSVPPVSYLHLFKSSGMDEKELERLEINEESVVFVAEEDVGGRKHVVKVGGVDVGALKKELNHEECGRTMWFLHITDPGEAQKWITLIKTAILGQRTMRAGLGLPGHTLGGIEPRGDMDVMLYMRAQGLITSPSPTGSGTRSTPPQTVSQPDRHYASSISSHRSQSTVSRPASAGAVSTFKGLFTGSTRPRSASRAASIESNRTDREPNDESFASMGSNLLNMLRPNTAEPPNSPFSQNPIITHSTPPFSGPVTSERRLERKIVAERQPIHWVPPEPFSMPKDRANRALSLGAFSLQPPPRKRWTSIGPTTSTSKDFGIYSQAPHGDLGTSTSLGVGLTQEKSETEPSASPTMAGFHFGTPEQRPRAPSLQSVSTLASGEPSLSAERSSSSTKRSSGIKRWSRQGVLPQRLTPPSGPPPSVPYNQSSSRPHPYAVDRSPSRASSSHSITSQQSVISSLPSFSKRASASSAFSVTTSSTSQSQSRPTSTHRMSMPPPPRPAPTFALPPAPDQDVPAPDSAPPSKSPFRDSVAHRAFRLSMIAPKPPPSTVLPPRPDEPGFKSHRRSSSTGSYTHPAPLDSIPASPIPPALPVSPFPPPLGPLPPTPVSSSPTSSSPPSRPVRSSIRERLRNLSAPSPSSLQLGNHTSMAARRLSRPSTAAAVAPVTTSPPATPIAEKITLHQNDPSFLQLHTPITPFSSPPRPLTPPPEHIPEHTSLSPPPRRGSKQISVLEIESEASLVVASIEEDKLSVEGGHKLMSLSRPGSVVSLGIVSM